MNNETILTVDLVIEALKTSYSLREASRKIYKEWSRKCDKRIIAFLKKNGIDRNDYLLTKEKKYCKYCGKEIIDKYSNNKQFCNLSCASKYNNGKRRKNTSGYVFDGTKDYYCLNCGKKIEYVYASKVNKFCNIKCQKEYAYKQYINKWKNGEVDGVVSGYDISSHVRRYMLEKANHQCTRCGWHEINPYTGRMPLQIHHIDGNCLNNREDNLEVLCPNCHSLTDNFGSRNKNCTEGRTKYHTSKYRELRDKGVENCENTLQD